MRYVDTFELLPSLAQGELSETSAPELVAAVFRSRASGTLWLETAEGVEIRVFFRTGDMCGTGPFEGFQTLAHVLLANDWVGALDIEASREEAVASKRRHGEVLVGKGLLTPEQLRSALMAQHTTNLSLVLGLTQGRYDWRGSEPPPPWAREVAVDPVSCLVDALESDMHEARRRKVIDWLGAHPVRLSLDWPELQGRIELAPVDRRAAALLALPRHLDEFVRASRLPQTRAEALLAALLLAGAAEPQPEGSATAVQRAAAEEPLLDPLPEVHPDLLPEVQPEPEVLPETLPEADSEPELLPVAAETELEPMAAESDDLLPELQTGRPHARPAAAPRRATVGEDEALARLESLSLDELPPTPPGPPQVHEEELEIDESRRAPRNVGGNTGRIHREEVTFDPDAAGLQSSAGSDEGRSRDLRKKMMARGLRNLGMTPSRPDLEGAVEARPAAGPMDTSQLSTEDKLFADEVHVRVRRAPRQNAYVRLGVAEGATSEQIKTAYLQAAKRFHPDRASAPGMAALEPELQTLFGLLKEAYETIATSEARARYDQLLKAGGKSGPGPGSRKDEAAISLKMGDVLLKKRDFEAALQKLRRAVDLDPSGDALAALAWGLVCDPKATPATKEEAASLINRALRAPGATARTFYVAGVFWRTKDPDSAVDAFRKALEMDPNHSDAALELRLIEQRRGKQGKTGGGVLSGLLFGKRKS